MTQYDTKKCTIIINDSMAVTGLGEDMVTFAKDEEFFSTSVGAQGDVMVNVTNNDLCTITLTLQPTSPQKATLIQYGKNRTQFSMWVTNASIGEQFGGNTAMVKNFPELGNGSEAEDREFEIQVFDGTVNTI